MDLLEGLEAFFRRLPLSRGDRLVVAFSGGGDSTALLWGLAQLAPAWAVRLVAAHLDHDMDAGSRGRAASAAALAARLAVPMVVARREVAARRRAAESLEAAARRIRYEFLEEVRHACQARYVATAHHRDDQAETLLLRLRFGSGLRGMAGIQPVAGTLVRPVLEVPRRVLRLAVAAAGLTPCEDPGNADPRQPRSRMRHRVLPALTRAEAPFAGDDERRAGLVAGLARLAARAQRALPALDRRLAAEIGLRDLPAAPRGLAAALPDLAGELPEVPGKASAGGHASTRAAATADIAGGDAADAPGAATADAHRLSALPPEILPHALALLHHRAGRPLPPSRAAAAELRRQLRATAAPAGAYPGRVTCDCGGGWRWHRAGDRLHLRRAPAGEATAPFTYTLEVPGELTIAEIAVTIRVSRQPVEAWMLRGAPLRAGLALPPQGAPEGATLTVRNRRPGDRLRPLGSPGSRKLKEVLIDRGVPQRQRDRLPLLCWAGEIAWVPGVTIAHRFRLTGQPFAVLAEIVEIVGAPHGPAPAPCTLQ